MRALANKRNFLKGLTCWVVSFTLVFSLFATPAYASESTADVVEPLNEQVLDPATEDAAPSVDVVEEALPETPVVTEEAVSEVVEEAASSVDQVETPAATEEGGEEVLPTDSSTGEGEGEGGIIEEAPFSLDVVSSYDSNASTINYTLTLNNPTDRAFEGVSFDTFVFVDPDVYYIDLPTSVDLAPGETKTINASLPIAYDPATAEANFATYSVTAMCGDFQVYASGDTSLEAPAVDANYQVNVDAVLLDADGNKRPVDVAAVPGDMVEYYFTVTNTGTAPLPNVHAIPLSQSFGAEGDWFTPTTLQPGESISYVGRYYVTEEDAKIGSDEAGVIDAHALIFAGSESKEWNLQSVKVAKPVYQYTINYYADSAEEGNLLGSYTSDLGFFANVTVSEDVMNRELPEGYKAKAADDALVLELTEDPAKNVYNVVYSRDTFAYTINYYVDSTEGAPVASVQQSAEFGQVVTVEAGVAEGQLNYQLPQGYTPLDQPLSITVGADPARNVVDIVYAKKNDYTYTIRYFTDSNEGDPLFTTTGVAQYGSTVAISEEVTNAHLPEVGYQPAAAQQLVVSDDEQANTVDVVYQRSEFGYTLNYYYRDLEGQNHFIAAETGVAPYQSELEFDTDRLNTHLPEVGYEPLSEAQKLVISENADQNVLDVVYQLDSFDYTINYYTDEVATDNLIASEQGESAFGSTVQVSTDRLNAHLPSEGYLAKTAGEEGTITITEDADANVLNVVYARASYEYTINYYIDSADSDANKLETVTGTAEYGYAVQLTADRLNAYLPEGYIAKTDADATQLSITADPARNTIDVVYQRDSFAVTVNYYKDAISQQNLIASVQDSGVFGRAVTVPNAAVNVYRPDGYAHLAGTRYIIISADESQNVIDIVYEKETTLPFRVNYYRDSVDEANLITSEMGYGTFEAPIPFTNGANLPAGYAAPGEVSGATTIGTSLAESTLNVVYHRADIGYTVNYYKDEVAADNLLHSDTGVAPYLSVIPYVPGAYLPEGYTVENLNLSGASVVSAQEANNVLNVVYSKDDNIAYTVNYYAGSLDGRLLGSTSGFGTFGDMIPYDANAYLEPGYSASVQVSGMQVIGANAAGNVLNVVYPVAEYGYTVNYYQNSISEENLLGTDTGMANYLEPIPYTDGAYLPEGYVAPGTLSGSTTVSYDAQNNVLNVVYQPGMYEFTINYYRGSVSSQNLIASMPQDARTYGSTVQISADELNMQLPQGYTALEQGMSLQITSDPARNVLNVVFYPNFEDFYAAGIGSLNVTYNGNTHYVAPNSVLPGDIITYTYNGTTQTRVVGRDANIGAEFQEVTNGDVPVLVTLTRAGITSNALQTVVNIAPAPTDVVIPPSTDGDTSQQPTVPDGGVSPDRPMNTPGTNTVIDAITQWVNPAIAVPTPSYNAQLPADQVAEAAQEEPGAGETTIEDDLNPLASSPLSTKNGSHQGTDIFGIVLLLLATMCAAAAIVLLAIRKRRSDQADALKGTAVALERAKISKMTLYAALLGAGSLLLYVLWVILRI